MGGAVRVAGAERLRRDGLGYDGLDTATRPLNLSVAAAATADTTIMTSLLLFFFFATDAHAHTCKNYVLNTRSRCNSQHTVCCCSSRRPSSRPRSFDRVGRTPPACCVADVCARGVPRLSSPSPPGGVSKTRDPLYEIARDRSRPFPPSPGPSEALRAPRRVFLDIRSDATNNTTTTLYRKSRRYTGVRVSSPASKLFLQPCGGTL